MIRYWKDESGLGTVEMVLILAVLVGIALIFREYIFGFVADILANIMGGDVDAIRNNPVQQ
jgi:Flp pilus assembly pilin Flp